jgi:hypothetical protein
MTLNVFAGQAGPIALSQLDANFTALNSVLSVTVTTATGDGSTVNFTLPFSPGSVNNVRVVQNGLMLTPTTDYNNTSGSAVIQMSVAPSLGDELVFWIGGQTATGTSSDSSLISYSPSGAGAVATTVQTKLRESVSVKDFGAKGDGVTDDTAAIQKALDSIPNYASAYCPSKGSGGAGEIEVIFPHGSYIVSSVLVNNMRGWAKIRGIGRVNIYSSSSTYVLDMASCYYCDVSNINLISSTAGVGIYMNRATANPYCDYNTFNNLNVTLTKGITANAGLGTIGLYINRCEQNIFTNCAFNADCTLWNDVTFNAAFPVTNGTQDNTISSNTVNTFIQCNWTKNGSAQYGMVLNTATAWQFINNYCHDLMVTSGSTPYFLQLTNCTRLKFEADFDACIRFANVQGYNYFNDFHLLMPSVYLDGSGVFTFDTAGSNYLAGGNITVYCSGTNTGKYIFKNTSGAAYMDVSGNVITTYSTSPVYSLVNGAFTGNVLKTEVGVSSINFGGANLSAYIEGTWTPNITGTATYTTQVGTYTKVGRLVTVHGHLKINVLGTGVGYEIAGLPFLSANDGIQSSITINQWSGLATTPVYAVGYVYANSQIILLNAITAANATLGILTILTGGSEVYFSGSYLSAT